MSKIKYSNLKPFSERNCSSDIETENYSYDLHTDADFFITSYNIEERKAELIWKYPGVWFLSDDSSFKDNKNYEQSNDIEDEIRYIALIFRKVTRYEITPRDSELPFTEDNCLTQIMTYDADNNFNEDILVFEFQSGFAIKIEAEEISFDRDFNFP